MISRSVVLYTKLCITEMCRIVVDTPWRTMLQEDGRLLGERYLIEGIANHLKEEKITTILEDIRWMDCQENKDNG